MAHHAHYWFHFGSTDLDHCADALRFFAVLSVFWATMLAIARELFRRDTALVPTKLVRALAEGTNGRAQHRRHLRDGCIIVGVTTLTGLARGSPTSSSATRRATWC